MDRYKFQSIAESIGEIRKAITNEIGDISKTPAARLQLETALARIYGSTLFHDEDVSALFLKYETQDSVGLGFQSVEIESLATSPIDLPMYAGLFQQDWKPDFPPPCPEGWDVFEYRIWKHYMPTKETPLQSAWIPVGTELDINSRSGYEYPVRYKVEDGAGYERVPMFKSGRFITLRNLTASNIQQTITFELPEESLSGIQIKEDINGSLVTDVNIYWHPDLVFENYNPSLGNILIDGEKLKKYNDSEDVDAPKFKITINEISGNYVFEVNVPFTVLSDKQWEPNFYWHIIMYWGSTDDYIPLSASGFVGSGPYPDIDAIPQYKKNYFDNHIVDNLNYNFLGVNDTSGYMVANNRTHYTLLDGGYGELVYPEKYTVPVPIKTVEDSNSWTIMPPKPLDAIDSKVVGYANITINKDSVVPIIFCIKTGSTMISRILSGPELTPEFFPDNWDNCNYFPKAPPDYTEVARFIVGKLQNEIHGLPEYGDVFSKILPDNNIVESNLSIFWMRQSISTFAAPPIDDEYVFLYILPALKKFATKYRSLTYPKIIADLVFSTIAIFAGTPDYLTHRSSELSDVNGAGSNIFRGLLKTPYTTEMMLDGRSSAIYLSSDARESIADLAGLPSTVEFLKFEANNMYLTREMLKTPNRFEIYQEYSDQCYSVDLGIGGTKINNDYTLRLELIDGDQNILLKDWYIMASRYFLTQEEYNVQQQSNQGVLGYFTQDTIINIDQWRLYGYAGIVPDLSMEKAKPLGIRVVSPEDSTKITEEQFRQTLANQGLSESAIDERVAIYIEDNGEFYVVNNSQYSDYFVGVNNAALTTTTYTYASEPYWKTAFPDYFQSYETMTMDSFTIAVSGINIGDLETSNQYASEIVGAFNRYDNIVSSVIAPKNDCRQLNVSYKVEGYWGFNIKKFADPQILMIYPRAVLSSASGYFLYIPNNRDIHVYARMMRGRTIVDSYNLVPAGNTSPIQISDEPVDSLVFLSIAKGNDKYSVRLSTTQESDISFNIFKHNVIYSNINITALDGKTLNNDDRVLIQHLTGDTQKYNGIYKYSMSASGTNGYPLFTRADDMNDSSQIYNELAVRVLDGGISSVFKNKYYALDIPDTEYPVILNQTNLVFAEAIPPMPVEFYSPKYGGSLSDKFVIRSR